MDRGIKLEESHIKDINTSGVIDLSYLNTLVPYKGDKKEYVFDIKKEIQSLENEMNNISLSSIPFKSSDFVVIFLSGLIGGICDVIMGKPADGYSGLLEEASEPEINDDFAFGMGKYFKQYDLKNNPIDKTIPGISVGDHRLYSYGHDLLRFFQTIPVIMSGTGEIGVSGLGGVVELVQAPENYPGVDSIWEAIIVLALHLYKDYCSARSLPIPGSTLLASLNKDTMPEFLDKLTNDMEFNLRTLNGQLLSVATIEIMIGIYNFIQKNTDDGKRYTEREHKEKKEKMLLMAHSIAMMFNTGKVVLTENPAFINFPQIIRIVKLAWNGCKENIDRNHKAITKTNMGIIKNKLETMDTLILLDEAIYYTKQIDRLIVNMKFEFDEVNNKRNKNLKKGFRQLDEMMTELKKLNS